MTATIGDDEMFDDDWPQMDACDEVDADFARKDEMENQEESTKQPSTLVAVVIFLACLVLGALVGAVYARTLP